MVNRLATGWLQQQWRVRVIIASTTGAATGALRSLQSVQPSPTTVLQIHRQDKKNSMASALLFASCCLVSFCGCVSGLSAVIDTSERLPFVHNWKKCVGSGHMLLGTRADWRSHLLLAKNELGFVGVRGHGLLDDDMSVVPSKAALPEFYNVDQVMSGGHPSRWSADGGLHPTRSGDGLPDLEWNQAGC